MTTLHTAATLGLCVFAALGWALAFYFARAMLRYRRALDAASDVATWTLERIKATRAQEGAPRRFGSF